MRGTALAFFAALAGLAAAQTNLTGDILNGVPVISYLDLADVPPRKVSRYYLRAGELNGGLAVHIPLFVARGTEESLESGKKLSLSGSVHGDELNPVRVIQRVFEELEGHVGELNGTVIGIPTVNPVGIYLNQRNYFTASSSGFLTNVNRVFPGTNVGADGGNGAEYLAYSIWNYLWANTSQVDVALDVHTPSTGMDSSLWCYADFRLPYVERLAKLLQPNTLKIDPGEPGSIETTFVEYGVPAITVEIGAPKVWQPELIKRTVDFVFRVLDDLYITPHEPREPYEPDLSETYIGTTFQNLPVSYGGFIDKLVDFDDVVVEGQTIGYIRNAFGDVLETITSPANGRIHQAPRDPSAEPGEASFSVVYNSTDPECADGCIL